MRLSRSIGKLAPLLAGAALLSSCSLRLPVHHKPVAATVPPSKPVVRKEKPFRITDEKSPDVIVYLLGDTLHTGVVFPYDWLVDSGFVPPEGFGDPVAVSMSWGNRDAYVEKRWLSPWKVFRALFTPSPSVMELVSVNWNVPEVVPHQRVYQKLVPRSKGREVAAFLNNCSRMGPDGRPINIGPASWGDGVLLESRHNYFLPRICNVWTVQALEATGCDMNAQLGLTANGVIRQATTPENGFSQIWLGPEEGTQKPD